ncbi:hypothetical protein ISCGN_013864 [Ixodes scapularis]
MRCVLLILLVFGRAARLSATSSSRLALGDLKYDEDPFQCRYGSVLPSTDVCNGVSDCSASLWFDDYDEDVKDDEDSSLCVTDKARMAGKSFSNPAPHVNFLPSTTLQHPVHIELTHAAKARQEPSLLYTHKAWQFDNGAIQCPVADLEREDLVVQSIKEPILEELGRQRTAVAAARTRNTLVR